MYKNWKKGPYISLDNLIVLCTAFIKEQMRNLFTHFYMKSISYVSGLLEFKLAKKRREIKRKTCQNKKLQWALPR